MALEIVVVGDDQAGTPLPGDLHDVACDIQGTTLYQHIVSGIVPHPYDYVALTYVTVGNGIGEIETITFKTGGASGTTVATVTFAYDANDKISSVTKV